MKKKQKTKITYKNKGKAVRFASDLGRSLIEKGRMYRLETHLLTDLDWRGDRKTKAINQVERLLEPLETLENELDFQLHRGFETRLRW